MAKLMKKRTIGMIARRQRNKDGAVLELVKVLNRALLFDEEGNPVTFEVQPGQIIVWRGIEVEEETTAKK